MSKQGQKLLKRVMHILVKQKVYWKVHPRDLWDVGRGDVSEEELKEFPPAPETEPSSNRLSLDDRTADLFIEESNSVLCIKNVSDRLNVGVSAAKASVLDLARYGVLERVSDGYRLARKYKVYERQLAGKRVA